MGVLKGDARSLNCSSNGEGHENGAYREVHRDCKVAL